MKKFLLSILVVFLGLAINAQTALNVPVTPNGYINGAYYGYVFGTSVDTLTNTDTLTWVVRVKGNDAQDFNIKLYIDFVSGISEGIFGLLNQWTELLMLLLLVTLSRPVL